MNGPRWYRLLLFALPPDFRRAYGDDMAEATLLRLREAPWLRPRARVLAAALHDLALTIAREWAWRCSGRPLEHSLRQTTVRPTAPPRKESSVLDRASTIARHASRRLSHQWATSLLVVATLAIGVGSTVAIYSYVHAALVRPLPFERADSLVRVWPGKTFSKKMLDRFAEETTSYEAVAGYSGWLLTLTGEQRSDEVHAVAVTPGFFDVLSVSPSLGRVLRADDSAPGAESVVVLGHALWRTRFGADPNVVDSLVDFGALDGDEATEDRRRVVGVLPARYESIVPEAEIFFPLTIDPADSEDYGGSWYLKTVGRLGPGATPDSATAELATVARRLKTDFRGISEEDLAAAKAVPLHRWIVGDVQRPLLILLGAVAMVLLVACTNVASLLIARTASRRGELRLRSALGANRGQLVTELLAESTVLAAVGGTLGILLARVFGHVASTVVPQAAPRLDQAGLNQPVLAFALAVTLLVALLAGLPAAWRVVGKGMTQGWQLRTGSRRVGERAQLSLIVVEVALSVMLLVGAGLVLKSFWRLLDVEPGFQPQSVTALRITAPSPKYQGEDAWRGLNQALYENIGSIPGVTRAGGIHLLPMTLNNWNFPYTAEVIELEDDEVPPTANYRVVVGDYFGTLKIPLIGGRTFGPQDHSASEPVVVINEALADQLWGPRESLGRELLLFMDQPHRIVGVVGNVRQHKLDLAPQPEMYYPVTQRWSTGGMAFMVHSELPPETLFPSLRDAVRAVDPAVAIGDLMSMEDAIGRSVAEQRSIATLLGGFAAVAIFLSLVGVYGVMAFLVGRRLRDIGIRMALGARRGRVVREGMLWIGTWIVSGLVIGALGTIAVGRWVGGLLYEVESHDLFVLTVVLVGVGGSALLASLMPMRRASRLDPVRVLRAD